MGSMGESVVISQLRYADGESLADCYLNRLAMSEGLEWFKQMLLVSSSQDEWVPYESVRMQVTNEASSDSPRGANYINMVRTMMNRLQVPVIYRLDVNFNIEAKNFDSMLGRTAHMLVLQNEELLKMIISRYRVIFN